MTHPDDRGVGDGDSGLARAIAGVYGGPLEQFVPRRDLLAKQLRAEGRREDALLVKGLRKPARLAWALDRAALDSPATIADLEAAVAAMIHAQAGAGNVRAALAQLRQSAHAFAAHAVRAAQSADHRLDEAAVSNAVLAVLGNAQALGELRSGRLVEVPGASGFDGFDRLRPGDAPDRPGGAMGPALDVTAAASSESADLERAREAERQAAVTMAAARERKQTADHALQEIESQLQRAEQDLRQAETQVRTLHTRRERARRDAEDAAQRLSEAETALADSELTLRNSAPPAHAPTRLRRGPSAPGN